MADVGSDNGYKSGLDFEEDNRDPVLPISLSGSTELWLIQWPINRLQPADLQGKELSLKLHRDGNLARFENSSGKSYEMISFTAQEPDATVFLPSSTDLKVVGKVSRRVCLVGYPEPGDKLTFSNPNMSGIRLEGSRMKTLSQISTIQNRSSHDALSSRHSIGLGIVSPLHQSRKNKHKDSTPALGSMRSAEQSSLASEPKSHLTQASIGSARLHGDKLKKKKLSS